MKLTLPKVKERMLSTGQGFRTNKSGACAFSMDLIGDEFAATDHVEKRINLATAGGTSKKGRNKSKLRGENNYMEPIEDSDENDATDSIGIFDDESRVE